MRLPFPGEVIEIGDHLCLVLGPTADGRGQRTVKLTTAVDISDHALSNGRGKILSLENALQLLAPKRK